MIKIHDKHDFEKMRAAGKLAAQLLSELGSMVKPGITALDLDAYAAQFIAKYGAKSACYGYLGRGSIPFPGLICTSINHVICHAFPTDQVLSEGDIISIDVTLIVDGYYGDTCATFAVGKISPQAQALIYATKDATETGIKAAHAGNYFGDIGHAIEELIRNKYRNKYSIVEDYCGHGIGTVFHAPPQVEHVGLPGTGQEIKEGMFFTIEPMINMGSNETRLLKDGWTVITKDYSLSAQFEHTIGITENGPEVFTNI